MPEVSIRKSARRDNVLSFVGSAEKPEYAITQRDLTEERMLNIEAVNALKALEAKRKIIRKALLAGGIVEPGLRSACFIDVSPESYSVNPKPYKKLIVR